VGNKRTNFREIAEAELRRKGVPLQDLRSREIRGTAFEPAALAVRETAYETTAGRECFLEWVTPEDRVVAFLRLLLSAQPSFVEELGEAALIRELHVYGEVAELNKASRGRAQHRGLGRRLVDAARARADNEGYERLAVISAMGTRPYYRRLGFQDGVLYQHLALR
ncbi:MAG: GNAT family N-acetyltransferase, partial [Myxococcota bacterium]